MFRKPMTFIAHVNQEEDMVYPRCLENEKHREPEAYEHLNRVGGLIKSLPTGHYLFEFKPKFGLFWNYEYTRIEWPENF